MTDRGRSLLGGGVLGQIKVERALAEIRSGRPIAVIGPQGSLIATPVEALDEALAADLEILAQGRARLILAAPRLRRLGLERDEAGALALPKFDLARIATLAIETDARIDAPVSALAADDQAALERSEEHTSELQSH